MLIAAPTSGCKPPSALSCPTTPVRRQPVFGSHASQHAQVGRRHRAMLAGTALLAALFLSVRPGLAAGTASSQSGVALGGIQQKMIETLGELVKVLPVSHMPVEA